jgi:hypothetical protein
MKYIRMASAALTAMVLAVVPASVTLADRVDPADGGGGTSCSVRNITQGTRDHSFRRIVAAANGGDRLQVRGTCSGGVTIRKSISIEGLGSDATLSGRDRFRVLTLTYAAFRTPHVRIRDIRIVRGRATREDASGMGGIGGGILVMGARLTLTDSVVSGNIALGAGGIAVDEGDVTLRRSVVRGNTATRVPGDYGYGGGLWITGGSLKLIRSVVRGNRATVAGGIVDFGSGGLTLVDSSVRRNSAERGGGGVLSFGAFAMRGSSVTANTAGGDGGGIVYFQEPFDALELVGSTVSDNSAAGHGGGIFVRTDPGSPPEESLATLADTTVSSNHAGVDGGGSTPRPGPSLPSPAHPR